MTFRRFPLAVAIVAAFSFSPAVSQTVTAPAYKDTSNQVRSSTAVVVLNPDGTAASSASARTTAAGTSDTLAMPVQGVTGGVPQNVQGATANGSTVTGNPNLIAGSDGTNVRTLRTNSLGGIFLASGSGTNVPGGTISSDGLPATNEALRTLNFGYAFNGTTWDRMRGDTSGAYMVSKGGSSLVTAQVSVAATATLVAAARTGRSRLVITQSAAGPCYYGPTAAVSATTGARMTVAGASKTYQYAGALYGICPGGAVTTDVDEEF